MHHVHAVPSPLRLATPWWRLAVIVAMMALALLHACAQLVTMPPRSQQLIPLPATPASSILYLEGRLDFFDEISAETAIRLYLNSVLLDGSRLLGSNTILFAENPRLSTPPFPRYSSDDHCFAFPVDPDFIAGNGPFHDELSERTIGCPYLLQLKVGDLLQPKGNELYIINGSRRKFVIRQCTLQNKPLIQAEPLLHTPAWTLFYYSAEMRARYTEALGQDLFNEHEKAHILAALGTGELLRAGGDRALAVRDWQQALASSTSFNLRGEAAYRLAAERQLSGKWADEKTEALVRAAAVGNDAWAELAAALLTVMNRRPVAQSPRPIICPPLVHGPQKVDGVLDEPFWKTLTAYPLTNAMASWRSDSSLPYYKTDVRVAVLPDGLALGFTGDLPDDVHWRTGLGRDESVWEDNCVECFIAPSADLHYYYELNATPLGGQFDGRHEWWWKCNPGWNGKWQTAARLNGTQFTIEYFVPWTDFGLTQKPPSGTVFLFDATRYLVRDTSKEHDDGIFYTLTPHRAFDCHRLMDGALLVIP